MLLRRITEHVRAQNWAAVVIDFFIVVVGVFIGIQVSNWNEGLAFERREQVLLRELRSELAQNIVDVESKGAAFMIGADSARRILGAIEHEGPPCTDDCWPIVVDLMHASQWQQIMTSWSTYDELRREGLPSDRQIIEMVEKYKTYGHQVAIVLSSPPRYRALVRGLIPIGLQDAYWQHCYALVDAIENYLSPCPAPDGVAIDPAQIAAILADRELVPSLREWTSISRVVAVTLSEPQIALGNDILKRIDEQTGVRP